MIAIIDGKKTFCTFKINVVFSLLSLAGKLGLPKFQLKLVLLVKGTVMQIEKALINDRLCVSKVS